MVSVLRSCLQSLLKLVNSIIGIAGIAIIIYALWMFRVWQRNIDDWPFGGDSNTPIPWFIFTTFGIGVYLCLVTFSGHIAAETANGHCLSCYMLLVLLSLLLEGAVIADIFLNQHWEEDFPEDPTGSFNGFKNFVSKNFEISKWIGLSVVGAQGLTILLSMIVKALGPDSGRDYDSDDDYAPARLPLLKNPVHPPAYIVSQPHFAPRNDSWNIRIHDKANK